MDKRFALLYKLFLIMVILLGTIAVGLGGFLVLGGLGNIVIEYISLYLPFWVSEAKLVGALVGLGVVNFILVVRVRWAVEELIRMIGK